MVHTTRSSVVTHEQKAYSKALSPRTQEVLEYVMESLYVMGSLMFTVGSLAFWPDKPRLKAGCRLFDAGSVIFFLMSLCIAAEMLLRPQEIPLNALVEAEEGSSANVLSEPAALRKALESAGCAAKLDQLSWAGGRVAHILETDHHTERVRCHVEGKLLWLPFSALTRSRVAKPKGREILEQTLYVLGSLIFMVGTIIWDPSVVDALNLQEAGYRGTWWRGFALVLFMLGSFIFAMAAYVNALTIYETYYNKTLRKYALAIATCYEFGGFCFIAGTMGFIPAEYVGCNMNMEKIGCTFYFAGSCLYFVGSVLSLCKTFVQHHTAREHEEKVRFLQRWVRKKQDVEELPERREFLRKQEAARTIQQRVAQRRCEKLAEPLKQTLLDMMAKKMRRRKDSAQQLELECTPEAKESIKNLIAMEELDDEEFPEAVKREFTRRIICEFDADEKEIGVDRKYSTASDWQNLEPLFGGSDSEQDLDDEENDGFWKILARSISGHIRTPETHSKNA